MNSYMWLQQWSWANSNTTEHVFPWQWLIGCQLQFMIQKVKMLKEISSVYLRLRFKTWSATEHLLGMCYLMWHEWRSLFTGICAYKEKKNHNPKTPSIDCYGNNKAALHKNTCLRKVKGFIVLLRSTMCIAFFSFSCLETHHQRGSYFVIITCIS